MKVVGVIPARGRSTGIPNKNLRMLLGHPLIHYITKAALGAGTLSDVYVSTDSPAIAAQATADGASVILHPAELSVDNAPTFGVIRNALAHLEQMNVFPDVIVTMRATSPLCESRDIDSAVELLRQRPDAGAVISVGPSAAHPWRILRITSDGWLKHYGHSTEDKYPAQRQSFESVYVRNGAVYASRAEIIRDGGLWGGCTLPYVMSWERSVNINEEIDFLLAEMLLGKRNLP
ncbi:MAG: acylneuraminate cytidylyltransferase family protein [Candidatus Andersenbacteria bacterium]|nr:acylneuraminate cytidylyltransferase family protein [Candidatus Andersenbacteria bacterium]